VGLNLYRYDVDAKFATGGKTSSQIILTEEQDELTEVRLYKLQSVDP
jgi:hypothetical protein